MRLSGHMLLNILAGFTYNIMTGGIILFFFGLLPLAFITAFSDLELGISLTQAQVFVVLSTSYIKKCYGFSLRISRYYAYNIKKFSLRLLYGQKLYVSTTNSRKSKLANFWYYSDNCKWVSSNRLTFLIKANEAQGYIKNVGSPKGYPLRYYSKLVLPKEADHKKELLLKKSKNIFLYISVFTVLTALSGIFFHWIGWIDFQPAYTSFINISKNSINFNNLILPFLYSLILIIPCLGVELQDLKFIQK